MTSVWKPNFELVCVSLMFNAWDLRALCNEQDCQLKSDVNNLLELKDGVYLIKFFQELKILSAFHFYLHDIHKFQKCVPLQVKINV